MTAWEPCARCGSKRVKNACVATENLVVGGVALLGAMLMILGSVLAEGISGMFAATAAVALALVNLAAQLYWLRRLTCSECGLTWKPPHGRDAQASKTTSQIAH